MILLATFGLQKRPRSYRLDALPQVEAWARRWWLVDAQTPSEAREIVRDLDLRPDPDDRLQFIAATTARDDARKRIKRCGGHRAETNPHIDYKKIAGFEVAKGVTPPRRTNAAKT